MFFFVDLLNLIILRVINFIDTKMLYAKSSTEEEFGLITRKFKLEVSMLHISLYYL